MRVPPELTSLEAVAGSPLGGRGRSLPRRRGRQRRPTAALVAAVERTLCGGPPAVAFSGGRDSSLLLAVAALACRRAGLEPPLAITLRMSSALSETDETDWQQRVVDHLRIERWQRIEIDDELDLIGPYARGRLVRGELSFPANAHSVLPMLEAAGERSLIVGIGGDELLGPPQWSTLQDVIGRRRAPRPRDLLRAGVGTLPRTARGWLRPACHDDVEPLQWLSATARRRLAREAVRGFEEPVRFDAAIRHLAARRDVVLPLQVMQGLAAERGQQVHAPLLDTTFVDALARAGGAAGWGGRTAAMHALGRELLPAQVVARAGKAYFNRVFFGERSRAFAAAWSGEGLDATLVDAEAVRREWLSELPDFRTSMLLQSAWLADHARGLPHAI